MGGAVFASLDGETNFATVPERIENTLRGAIGAINDKLAGNRKSDRLPPAAETSALRKVLPISNISKVGDREVVRTRSLVRVSANLTLASTEFAAAVPPFNAQKLLAVAGADGVPADDQPGAEPDAEVSYVTRDLGSHPAQGQDRGGTADRRHHRARARHRQLVDRLAAGQPLPGGEPAGTGSRRADGLRRRRHARSLCRLRNPHRAGEHHAAAQDRRPDHRRQRLERALRHRQEGRHHRHHPQGDRRDRPTRPRRSRRRSAARPRQRPEGRPEASHPGDAATLPQPHQQAHRSASS